ncbi:MAG: hypothetical protein QXQ18_01910 [Candidatus Aenigmatarchaeota archaeon]
MKVVIMKVQDKEQQDLREIVRYAAPKIREEIKYGILYSYEKLLSLLSNYIVNLYNFHKIYREVEKNLGSFKRIGPSKLTVEGSNYKLEQKIENDTTYEEQILITIF